MPGLLRGVARTAVIAGTATHVSNNVSRRQAERWAADDQTQMPNQTVSSTDDQIAQLQQLGQLRDQGILTEEEFIAKKKQILDI
jgi:hypothetical protein